jgi:hypothetical protein
MAKDASTASAKYLARSQAAVQDYKDGIGRVSQPPGQAAARQKGAYVQGVTSQADFWAKRVGAVTLSDWQAAAQGKGGDRYASGVAAGAQKQAAFMATFLPKVQAIANSLPPRGTLDANIQRMTQQVRETAKLRGTM